ncbi:MAG: hypothetical protein II633_05250, partial [Bacteroidales bacterium]|nr:hypothetical protein [Bacteroidales bacterium]
ITALSILFLHLSDGHSNPAATPSTLFPCPAFAPSLRLPGPTAVPGSLSRRHATAHLSRSI